MKPARGSPVWWGGWGWGCILIAPPLAWAAAVSGHGITPTEPLRDLAFLALWATIEEVVFRGGVQRLLLHKMPARALGISASNAITSLLFAALHLWAHPPLVALGVLPVSLLLGAAYERSAERLRAPIALHLYFNGLLYAATFFVAGR